MTSGAVLLDDLTAFVRRFVALTTEQAWALALWIAHTHTFDCFDYSPYLALTSPEKRSGKSTVLKVLELVVASPWRVVTPSEAVVYRKIERDHPTLLLDEVDAIWNGRGSGDNHEGLRALLNAGNERGVRVPRCAGPHRDQLVEFDTFCPKALAGIGQLPDTVADRAITVGMKRRARNERVERFRRRDLGDAGAVLRDRVADWVEPQAEYLSSLWPALPDDLDDRAADAWEPLLAIADAAGDDWPAQARRAALTLSGHADDDDDSLGVRLLADIRRAFGRSGADRITTADMLDALTADLEAPWATLMRGDRPITSRRFADLLRPFGVRSRTIRLDDGTTAKGYLRQSFLDAFNRYTAPSAPSSPSQRHNPRGYAESSGFSSVTCEGTETGASSHGSEDVAALRLDDETRGGAESGEGSEPVDQDEVERLAEASREAQQEGADGA